MKSKKSEKGKHLFILCFKRKCDVYFNFHFSFFTFGFKWNQSRYTEINFNFQFSLLDENRMDERYTHHFPMTEILVSEKKANKFNWVDRGYCSAPLFLNLVPKLLVLVVRCLPVFVLPRLDLHVPEIRNRDRGQ